MSEKTYKIQLEIRDVPGGLVRVAQVFSRRGCNIDSIYVEHTEGTAWSQMTITAQIKWIDQIINQHRKTGRRAQGRTYMRCTIIAISAISYHDYR